jgi:uncharacterized membrane protein YeaQ/YmgE (transglycosylase-associated protein family)
MMDETGRGGDGETSRRSSAATWTRSSWGGHRSRIGPVSPRRFAKWEDDPVNILLWILLGAIAGWLASVAMKTRKEQGLLMDIVVGIVGAILGGWIFGLFGAQGVSGFNLYSLLVAFVGAVVLLAIVRAIRR